MIRRRGGKHAARRGERIATSPPPTGPNETIATDPAPDTFLAPDAPDAADNAADAPGSDAPRRDAVESKVLGSSAIMAAGTIVSRLSGYVRGILLVAALGTFVHADLFTIGNTIPNMVYILLAGGVFNAVLVPQLVRAMKNDADGGEAYINRIVTLSILFLGLVTILLIVFAPWVMSVYLDSKYDTAEFAAQKDSAIAFARYCLPQVFFYGMFVLVGQILNSRGSFGPMMWAPIANNVISVAVLTVYLFVFGPVAESDLNSAFSNEQELLLGLGSSLGIAVQFLILLPFLHAAGVRYRPRFDFIGTGLGRTFRLAVWTIGFVIVNQLAYTVVVRLASSGTTAAAAAGEVGTGYTVYSQALLIMMVPHSVVTVSLTTAILPRLSASAATHRLGELGATLAATLRTTLVFVVPTVTLVVVVARDLANVIWGYGAASESFDVFVPSLVLFAPAIVLFTIHYMMLRGFYALEQTRRVFFIQCIIAVVNVAMAFVLVGRATIYDTSPALVLAYGSAYAVGAVVSYTVLARTVGGLHTVRFLWFWARLLPAVGLAAGAGWLLREQSGTIHVPGPGVLSAGVTAAVVAALYLAVFLLAARLLRIGEVNDIVRTISRKIVRR